MFIKVRQVLITYHQCAFIFFLRNLWKRNCPFGCFLQSFHLDGYLIVIWSWLRPFQLVAYQEQISSWSFSAQCSVEQLETHLHRNIHNHLVLRLILWLVNSDRFKSSKMSFKSLRSEISYHLRVVLINLSYVSYEIILTRKSSNVLETFGFLINSVATKPNFSIMVSR